MSEDFFRESEATPPPLSEHAQWSRRQFDGMKHPFGMKRWGVPRSGLVFVREGDDTLVLIARIPFDPAMPCSAEELHAMQQADVNLITKYFTEAGIKVVDRSMAWRK